MRWGRLLVLLLLAALVGVLVLWVRGERGRDEATDRQGTEGPALARSRPRSLEQRADPAWAWLWQRGVDGKRIAGRVVHAGRPVAKAVVRLATEELRLGEWGLAELETDRDGRFDFGWRPATRYRVVAQAEGLVAGGVALELRARDPRPAPDDVTIELRDCELVISGTVRDSAGGIIAGARVRAATRTEVFGTALSDDQGRYRVCLLAGPAHLEAGAEGYGTALEHTRGRRTARVDFALSPEVAIAGRVVDGAGEPVGRAVVVAETDGHDPGTLTESAADGRFRLEGLIAGTYRVVARHDDRSAEKTVAVTATSATGELLLTLEPRAILTGRVVVGGRPAGDVTVVVGIPDERWVLGAAVTQIDGRFAIHGLPRGPIQLEVERHKLLSPDATIDLTKVSQVELVCERRATVRGRVVRAGKPVPRADVELYQDSKRPYETVSKEDGSFAIEGVAAASYEIIATSHAEGATMARRPIAVGAQEIADLVLDLDRTASIAGAVVDASGAPVEGVMVGFAREDGEGGEQASDTTGADGTFTVSGLAGGRYRPYVVRSGNGWTYYRPAHGLNHPIVEVADGSSRVTGVELAISRADLTIAGRAVRQGEAVAGVAIAAFSHEDGGEARAVSGADGTFVLEGLAAGTYGLRADPLRGESMRVEAGARNVVLELPASGAIQGILRGFSRRPEVHVRGPNGERRVDVTDMRFAIDDVAVGTYEVSAAAPSGEHATAPVTVTADQVCHLTLTASATGKIIGVVKELRTGAPLAGVRCTWAIGDSSMRPVATDATGGFSFAVPTGTIRVECYGGHTAVAVAREVTVDVKPGATAHVVVEVVRIPRGGSPGRIDVHLEDVPPGSHRIRALQGSAASSGLRAGDVLLAVDGLPVSGLQTHVVMFLMSDRPVGAAAKLTVEREGTKLSFDVVAEAMPAHPGDE